MKQEAWKDITYSVNAVGVEMREVEEVKKKWNNLVSAAKMEYAETQRQRKKTGGGTPPPEMSQETANIVDIMKEKVNFIGIEGGIDTSDPFRGTRS